MDYKYYALMFNSEQINEIYRVRSEPLNDVYRTAPLECEYDTYYTADCKWHPGRYANFKQRVDARSDLKIEPVNFNSKYTFKHSTLKLLFDKLKLEQTELGKQIL